MRLEKTILTAAFVATLLFSGQAPVTFQSDKFQQQLSELTRRGFTYRMLDNDLIELTDPMSGEINLKNLCEPTEATIRAWAVERGIPILEIDPSTIDTSQYARWYTYWTEVPLSNSLGVPLIVGDLNRNGKPEVYGSFKATQFETRVYEIDSMGTPALLHNYIPRPGISRCITDVDTDHLSEVMFTLGAVASNYEQDSLFTIPESLMFRHQGNQGGVDGLLTGMFVGLLDKDTLNDFLYKGSEPDSAMPGNGIVKIYVAEYDHQLNDFSRVWSTTFYSGSQSGIGGFAVDDFDGDGLTEFTVTDLLSGKVFIVENSGDNAFVHTWQDSTPFVNQYYICSGDVDGDDRPEVFVGATMSSGNWTTMFEADSDNHYSPKFVFHLLSGATLDEPTYLTSDVEGDGTPELIILSGRDLYVFEPIGDNDYRLHYLKREDRKDAVQLYDLNDDGRKDIIISKFDGSSTGRTYADIYLASSLVNVRESKAQPDETTLFPNYPNPFNSVTKISFSLSRRERVYIAVYDILGGLVATLEDGMLDSGTHTLDWKASQASSGIYFCKIVTSSGFLVHKMILLR